MYKYEPKLSGAAVAIPTNLPLDVTADDVKIKIFLGMFYYLLCFGAVIFL